MKKLLSNKNVVTILGALLIVVVLYFFYNYRVNKAIQPISVPYALVTIGPGKVITSDMIDYVDIQESAIRGNVVANKNNIIGKYTNINVTIPAGSLFYKEAITEEKYLPDAFLKAMPEGMVAYNFRVDTFSTYGNSVREGTFVDLYFKTVDNGKILIGKLIENVKVLAVKDGSGKHVFEDIEENRSPSQIIFAVEPEMHELLRTAEYLANSALIIVPTGIDYNEMESSVTTEISNEEIKAYIEERRA